MNSVNLVVVLSFTIPETNSEFTPEHGGNRPLEKEIPNLETISFLGANC